MLFRVFKCPARVTEPKKKGSGFGVLDEYTTSGKQKVSASSPVSQNEGTYTAAPRPTLIMS